MSRSLAAAVTGLAAALLLTLTVGAGPASAHNVVVSTSPGTDSTVSKAPTEVTVTFDDVVLNLSAEGSSTVVTVADADGVDHATGCPTTQDRTISVPVSVTAPGDYTVSWRVVSADGHPVSGAFDFTYDPPAGASAAPPATADAPGEDPCGGTGTARSSDERSEGGQEGAPAGSGDLGVVLGVVGGVVVLAGAAVLVAVRVSRRRS